MSVRHGREGLFMRSKRGSRAALVVQLLACIGLVVASPADVAGQSARERLADYLLFYYVEFPNNDDQSYKPQLLDNQQIMAGTESGDFWLDNDVAVLHEFVRAALQEPPNAETARFQMMLSRILDIRGGRAAVYLVDDVGQPLADDGRVVRDRYGSSVDQSGKYVWPSARSSSRSKSYVGSFSMGAHYANSDARARSAFLHELMHLQLETDERPHLFISSGKHYVYGTDGDHYGNELIPDLSRTFDEAIANTMELLYDVGEARETFGSFQPDDRVLVEVAIPDPTKSHSSLAPEVWLDDQIREAGVRPYKTWNGYAMYRIADLPPRFIVHNELILALIFSEYVRRHIGFDEYVGVIRRANQRLASARDELKDFGKSRLTISATANFIQILCEEGTRSGVDPTTTSTAEPGAELLPLAFLDFFTGMAAETEEEFSDLFDGQLSEDWIRLYWTVGRPTLDAALGETMGQGRLTSTEYSDLDLIANAFGAPGNQM